MRMVDMGVKLVISETEVLQNENITAGSRGTVAQIPSFIDAVKGQLDAFTYTPGSCTATTAVDVNKFLVANKTAPEVLPFH